MMIQGLPVPEGAILLTPFEQQYIAAWQMEVEDLERRANVAMGNIRAMIRVIGERETKQQGAAFQLSPDMRFITKKE